MIGAFLLALTSAATPVPGCAAARLALPGTGACVESGKGVAVASDEAGARALLKEAMVAEQRFRERFGSDPAAYVVFSFDDPALGRTAGPALRKAGFRAVLPLPSKALIERQMAEAMSRAGPATGGVAPRVVRREGPSGGGEPRGENFIAHELGHHWYAAAFWSDAAAPTGPRYGSAAPDWLDEAAAMLMENDAGTKAYHQRFAGGRTGDAASAAMVPPEIPLAELTSMIHPAMASLPVGRPADIGPISVTGRPSLFYPQVRVFADYLAERSGEPRIIALISRGLRDGITFDAWLHFNASKHQLPASMKAMQTDWDAWLNRRFGSAPARG